jgi:OmpA-OmpF porin, OOP family
MRATALVVTLALVGLSASVAVAQPADRPLVLGEGQATEEAILDALSPRVTRQFKPGQRAQAAKASLLITFVTGSSELTDGARGTLDVLAGALKNERLAGRSFTIEGHADKRGSAMLNRQLSLARAQSVMGYLTSRHGLAAERLQAEGKGSSEPLNLRVATAPENRRVTIVVQPPR